MLLNKEFVYQLIVFLINKTYKDKECIEIIYDNLLKVLIAYFGDIEFFTDVYFTAENDEKMIILLIIGVFLDTVHNINIEELVNINFGQEINASEIIASYKLVSNILSSN
tara:strand:- start:640 stop:969 length:330 start_codon:yes stop_codon:yes gene_type:complete